MSIFISTFFFKVGFIVYDEYFSDAQQIKHAICKPLKIGIFFNNIYSKQRDWLNKFFDRVALLRKSKRKKKEEKSSKNEKHGHKKYTI